ncbi:MAG: MarR family transcriptional regulator [Microthrixaceae bacterium]|nr:MarR family transcriptional regulator [Microthrixaceae bacterium]
MTAQLTLDECLARATDPDTSHDAAAMQTPERRARGQWLALHHLAMNGPLTDFELAALTGWQQTSIGRRRKELVDAGLAERAEGRRPTPSGATAAVWRITEAGLASHRRGRI